MSTEPSSPDPSHPVARTRRQASWLLPILMLVILTLGIGCSYFWLTRPGEAPRNPAGAVVVFHIDRSQAVLLARPRSADPDEFENFRLVQSALIRHRQILSKALGQPGVADLALVRSQPDPIAWLHGNLRVSFGPIPNEMSVELDGEPATEAVGVLKAVAVAYLSHVGNGNSKLKERLMSLNSLHESFSGEIEMLHKRIDIIAQSLKHTDGPSMDIELASFQDELREAHRELHEANRNAVRADEGDTRSDAELKAARGRAVAQLKWVVELKSVLNRHGVYRSEVEKLKRSLAEKETLTARIRAEIDITRIESRAPSRVTLAEEPVPR